MKYSRSLGSGRYETNSSPSHHVLYDLRCLHTFFEKIRHMSLWMFQAWMTCSNTSKLFPQTENAVKMLQTEAILNPFAYVGDELRIGDTIGGDNCDRLVIDPWVTDPDRFATQKHWNVRKRGKMKNQASCQANSYLWMKFKSKSRLEAFQQFTVHNRGVGHRCYYYTCVKNWNMHRPYIDNVLYFLRKILKAYITIYNI